jgi:diguanylate cyclase (GGDEF)-like protein
VTNGFGSVPEHGRTAELTGLEIEAELGRGAHATVFRVRRGEERYALKRPRGTLTSQDALLALRREAALLACVDHPGVVRTHAVGWFDDGPALIAELIEGGSLADHLLNGRLPQERVVGLAIELAEALAAAHRTGLVHRDIKPQNIMLPPGRPAKLIDFGLALVGGDPMDRDQAVGTFVYTAPEQSGMLKRPVDHRSDLYSLGVVLFECLAGRPPFDAPNVGELLRMHTAAPVPDLTTLREGLAPELVEIVGRLLAKDPDDRHQSAEALLDDLRRCPGGDAVPTRPGQAAWPLWGRQAERDVLVARWQRARRGAGGVAVVRGPVGSGRSRLAAEVGAAGDGLRLRARCADDESLPLAPLRAAIEDHIQSVRTQPAAERDLAYERLREAAAAAGASLIRTLSPQLSALLGEASGGPSDGRDDRLSTALALFLGELARRHGALALEVDDAQWIDAASRRVLTLLAAELQSLPILVVLTELDGAGGTLATELGAAVDTHVRCDPLDPKATSGLIASRLPGAHVPMSLADHVAARTGGLPLAVTAYLLQLVDAGLLVPVWGTWRLDEAGLDALPVAGDAEALMISRLDGLPAEVADVLVLAAVVGNRFRPEIVAGVAGRPADEVAAALAVAVDRRVLEARAGGRYGFVHPTIRAALLARVPAEREDELHAVTAAALEALPEALHDPDHVYAVAGHLRRAGAVATPAALHRSALAAGLRALADQAPDDAAAYLTDAARAAREAGSPVGADILHPLAVAYLRSGRFADAGVTLEEALAGEPDPIQRAGLRATLVELHHTAWADDQAVTAAHAALAELGRPIPRNPLRMLLSTLGIAIGGALVRRTRLGFGTARGRRLAELTTLANVLDAGAYAAAIGLRLREAAILAMRALYAVNRLGVGPQYVRIYALLGYVAAVVHRRRTADRCHARAASAAAELGDPALSAYVEWVRGCALLFGGFDDGSTWEQTITKHARWFVPAQLITGYATTGIRLTLRGYVSEAQVAYERGLGHLPDLAQAYGTSFSMLGVMVPAQQGRPADAAAALADLRAAFPPGTGTPVQRANIATAAVCSVVEQGEFGAPFDEIIDEFHALKLSSRDMMAQHKWFYVFQAHGRMAQVRLSPDSERATRLAVAERAVHDLGKVADTPLLKVSYRLASAALAQQRGRSDEAIALADRAEREARTLDAPMVAFESARIRARAFRHAGLVAESQRQARVAHALATAHSWEHRRRHVRIEFGVDESGSQHRFTPGVDRSHSVGRNRRLEALQQVSAAAATILDPQRLARVALDETLRILGAERALLFLADANGQPMPFVGRDAGGADLDMITGYGSTLVHRVLDTGQALVVTGTEHGAALGSQSVVAHGLRSIMVAPVQVKGRVSGVVYLDSRMARGIFTEDDVEVLTAIVSHVAVSLETARAAQLEVAVQTARQQQELAETLRASLAELSAILEPDRLLHRLFATLHGQVGATTGCLLLGDGAQWTVAAVTGQADPELHGTVPSAEGIFSAHSATLLDAATVRTLPTGLLGDADTALVVPLVSRSGQVGVALLGGSGLDDTGREVAAALASQGMSAYDNARLFTRVQELATTDDLTGAHNRRHFYALAGALVDTAARGGQQLAAVMLDIDHFKRVNDAYGHGVGDDVIRQVAQRLTTVVRGSDVLGRYGGEEFAVILPGLDAHGPDLAERMRAAIAATPIDTRVGPVDVTISVGLAQLDPADAGLDQLLARADHALYRAKAAGRNRVERT